MQPLRRLKREQKMPVEKLIVKLFNEHRTWSAVARELGVSRNTVNAWRKRFEISTIAKV